MADLKLQVGLIDADRISKPFNQARRSTERLSSSVGAAQQGIRALSPETETLGGKLRALDRAAGATGEALQQVVEAAKDTHSPMQKSLAEVRQLEKISRDMDAFRRLKAKTKDGLSPRMQGCRTVEPVPPLLLGSIPAHAGLPPKTGTPRPTPAVYPRACGATRKMCVAAPTAGSLSLRMRGYLSPGRSS